MLLLLVLLLQLLAAVTTPTSTSTSTSTSRADTSINAAAGPNVVDPDAVVCQRRQGLDRQRYGADGVPQDLRRDDAACLETAPHGARQNFFLGGPHLKNGSNTDKQHRRGFHSIVTIITIITIIN